MVKIIILGAGYGGLMCAVELERAGQPFTLINKHDYHYFTTLLHEAAGGRNEMEEYKIDLNDVLRKDSSVVMRGMVTELRPQESKVITDQGEISYDYLVVALGNAPEYFGVPGMAEHAMLLRSYETARKLHEHIEHMFRLYHDDRDESRLRIIVGGAGLTGIELCGELSEWVPELIETYHVPQDKVQILNLEAAPTILPMLEEPLRKSAHEILTKKGVTLRTGTPIVKVGENQVELKTGEVIDAKTIVWTGGVRANPLIAQSGFEVDPKGRAKVNEFLQSVDYSNVFVIGDSAWFTGPDGKPLPPTGQAAMQQGALVAKNVSHLIKNQPMEPFHFHYMGTLASLGAEVGVGSVKGLKAKGVAAGLLKEGSKAKYLWMLGGMRVLRQKRGQLKSRH
jgi:NADH:ubiquinone reductase (H+-translocating)